MAEKYYMIADYRPLEFLGVEGLFTTANVDAASLPAGFYKYSICENADPYAFDENDDDMVYTGDFICNQELNFHGQESVELFDEYNFTETKLDLVAFFGDDFKGKLAAELDEFAYQFDPYEYNDQMPSGSTREDMVNRIYKDLSDKEAVNGMITYYQDLLSESLDEEILSETELQRVCAFIDVLENINARNQYKLEKIISMANDIKEKQASGDQPPQKEM